MISFHFYLQAEINLYSEYFFNTLPNNSANSGGIVFPTCVYTGTSSFL